MRRILASAITGTAPQEWQVAVGAAPDSGTPAPPPTPALAAAADAGALQGEPAPSEDGRRRALAQISPLADGTAAAAAAARLPTVWRRLSRQPSLDAWRIGQPGPPDSLCATRLCVLLLAEGVDFDPGSIAVSPDPSDDLTTLRASAQLAVWRAEEAAAAAGARQRHLATVVGASVGGFAGALLLLACGPRVWRRCAAARAVRRGREQAAKAGEGVAASEEGGNVGDAASIKAGQAVHGKPTAAAGTAGDSPTAGGKQAAATHAPARWWLQGGGDDIESGGKDTGPGTGAGSDAAGSGDAWEDSDSRDDGRGVRDGAAPRFSAFLQQPRQGAGVPGLPPAWGASSWYPSIYAAQAAAPPQQPAVAPLSGPHIQQPAVPVLPLAPDGGAACGDDDAKLGGLIAAAAHGGGGSSGMASSDGTSDGDAARAQNVGPLAAGRRLWRGRGGDAGAAAAAQSHPEPGAAPAM